MSKKLTELTALTLPPTGDDLIYVVDDPSSTPASKKVSLADAFAEPVFVENLGTDWNLYYLGAGVFRVVRTFTNAQVLTLASSMLVVYPADATRIIVPVHPTLFLAHLVQDYADIGASSALEIFGTGTLRWGFMIENPDGYVTALLANGTDSFGFAAITGSILNATVVSGFAGYLPSDYINSDFGIRLSNNGGDISGGDNDNTLTVIQDFMLLPIT